MTNKVVTTLGFFQIPAIYEWLLCKPACLCDPERRNGRPECSRILDIDDFLDNFILIVL